MNGPKDLLESPSDPGEYLRGVRVKCGFTLQQVEDATGVKKATLQTWETHPRLSRRTALHRGAVKKLAAFYGVSEDDIWNMRTTEERQYEAPRFLQLPFGGTVPCRAEDYEGPLGTGRGPKEPLVAVPIMPLIEKELVEVVNVAGIDENGIPDGAQIGLSADTRPLSGYRVLVEQDGAIYPGVITFSGGAFHVQGGDEEPRPLTGKVIGRIISVEWTDQDGTTTLKFNKHGLRARK